MRRCGLAFIPHVCSSLPAPSAPPRYHGGCLLVVAVQHERGPRNSTIRRQVAMYLRETTELASAISASQPFSHPLRHGPPHLPPNMYQLAAAAAVSLPPPSQ